VQESLCCEGSNDLTDFFFNILLTVRLSIILVINHLNAQILVL